MAGKKIDSKISICDTAISFISVVLYTDQATTFLLNTYRNEMNKIIFRTCHYASLAESFFLYSHSNWNWKIQFRSKF